ncbi:MAG: IS66 family transposase [Pyrinomonadaceae bacterium]|jgi:transposase|nr:IS66 family transposase [Pyrinomonadaceae bacterium]
MKREEIKAIYDLGPDAVFDLVERLFRLIEEQQLELATLKARVKELEDRLATNSRNSSKPPSSDSFGKKTKSLRQPGSKKSGAQTGHLGSALSYVETPDRLVIHDPVRCATCGCSLGEVASSVCPERRQVFDVPPLKLEVTEHRVSRKECPQCDHQNVGTFPAAVPTGASYGEGVRSLALYLNKEHFIPSLRTCAIFEALFKQPLAEGTLATAVEFCALELGEIEEVIKEAVVQARVGHFDETGMPVAGKRGWLHSASTAHWTHYAYHEKRGSAATEEIGILPQFSGRACHDGFQAYMKYGCPHSLCNAHHLRELTFLDEQLGREWAHEMKALLLEIKQGVDEAKLRGQSELPGQRRAAFAQRYEEVLSKGFAAEAKEPAPESGKRGRKKQSKAKNLLDRLRKYKEETLCFMKDFAVPFDNNLAERDLRMMKVQQKVSGCFRTAQGARDFCRIRSYISTMKKQGHNVLEALRSVFAGTPLVPASPG